MTLDSDPLQIDVAFEVEATDSLIAIDFLLDNVNLSKSRLKDIMNKGAVWLKRGTQPKERLRRAMTDLKIGDVLEVYYDEQLLSLKPAPLIPIEDRVQYSIWDKPSGMLIQGTEWGDHTALLRRVELYFSPRRESFLIHRLDREASGLVVIAHNRKMAATLTELFKSGHVKKRYRIQVLGDLREVGLTGDINLPLDGMSAETRYEFVRYDSEKNYSTVNIWLGTGRKHQIRRHFEHIGYPVIGDPKYGTGNKNHSGMKLNAVELSFRCPMTEKEATFSVYE